MGMYDEIKCEYQLPSSSKVVQNELFQTKEFDCSIDRYIITKKGELFLQKSSWITIPEKKISYGKQGYKIPIGKFAGSLKIKYLPKKKIKYHGDIRFYTSLGEHKSKDFRWYEFCARFTNGKLEWIKRLKNK